MRAAAEAGTIGIIASESVATFAGIVLPLLARIVIVAKSLTVSVTGAAPRSTGGPAMITGRAWAGGDVRDECDAAKDTEKCPKGGKFHKGFGILRNII